MDTKVISLRLPAPVAARLDADAAKRGLSRNALIVLAVERYFERAEAPPMPLHPDAGMARVSAPPVPPAPEEPTLREDPVSEARQRSDERAKQRKLDALRMLQRSVQP